MPQYLVDGLIFFMDFTTLILPPAIFSDAQGYILDLLPYDMQAWIQSQPRRVAEMLYDSTLGSDVYRALGFPDDNPELLQDCDGHTSEKITERVLFAVWVSLKTRG